MLAGNVSEIGLVEYFGRSGISIEEEFQNRDVNLTKKWDIPFSSIRKRNTNAF